MEESISLNHNSIGLRTEHQTLQPEYKQIHFAYNNEDHDIYPLQLPVILSKFSDYVNTVISFTKFQHSIVLLNLSIS